MLLHCSMLIYQLLIAWLKSISKLEG